MGVKVEIGQTGLTSHDIFYKAGREVCRLTHDKRVLDGDGNDITHDPVALVEVIKEVGSILTLIRMQRQEPQS